MNIRKQTSRALVRRDRYAGRQVSREVSSYIGWRTSRQGQRYAFPQRRPDAPADIHDLDWIADADYLRAFCRIKNDDSRTFLVLIPITRELALAPVLKTWCHKFVAKTAAAHNVEITEWFVEVEGIHYGWVGDVLWRLGSSRLVLTQGDDSPASGASYRYLDLST